MTEYNYLGLYNKDDIVFLTQDVLSLSMSGPNKTQKLFPKHTKAIVTAIYHYETPIYLYSLKIDENILHHIPEYILTKEI